MKISLPPFLSAFIAITFALSGAGAVEFSKGEINVLPLPGGEAPRIDGELSDWDLRGEEPGYPSNETAAAMNTRWAFMADQDALYVSAVTSLPGRSYENTNIPEGRFWKGDLLQFRFTSDPALPYPMNVDREQASDRVVHLSFWKNSETGTDYMHMVKGTKYNQGKAVNPVGVDFKIKVDEGKSYTMEARLPWKVLGVPDGKNPFGPGRPGAGVAEALWAAAGDAGRMALGFATDPGVFSFNRPNAWGRMVYLEKAPSERLRPTIETLILEATQAANEVKFPNIGVPITVEVPEGGRNMAVNIFSESGAVLREVFVGVNVPAGKQTLHWDGRDAFGKALPPGAYRWGAYFHGGLEEEFMGSVGMSGHPPFPTPDGRGQWGADHSNPLGARADASGLYLLWPVAEAGRSVVKIGYDGKTIFRIDPFSGGGFGPYFAFDTDGKEVFLARGRNEIFLARVDAATGRLLPWGEDRKSEIPVFKAQLRTLPKDTTPYPVYPIATGRSANHLAEPPAGDVYSPDCFGLAVLGDEVFLSSFSGDTIHVLEKSSGKALRTLPCPAPRGLLAHNGDLYAVSYEPGNPGRVVRFKAARGSAEPVITEGLDAPFGVAIDKEGSFYVSDLGPAQQVKIFTAQGKANGQIGQRGGRGWQGHYDSSALDFLLPVGVAVDAEGHLIIAESSPPKVITRLALPDKTIRDRWYGAPGYWNATAPMPDDPRNAIYMLSDAIGRGTVAGVDQVGVPNAYWSPRDAGYPFVDNIESQIPVPQPVKATNGRIYYAKDSAWREIYIFDGDLLRPIAQWRYFRQQDEDNPLKTGHLRVWVDANGDGQQQPEEFTVITHLADGSPLGSISPQGKTLRLLENGDVLFPTSNNEILIVPAIGFTKDGLIQWDLKAIRAAIPQVFPGLKSHGKTHRSGIMGMIRNRRGEYYIPFNARLAGTGAPDDFADDAAAKASLRGMGHTSTANAAKFLKFDAKGRLVWMAGQKATAGAKPGEMYHFWNLAGLVGEDYVAGASEWGVITFYTHDGFFVDSIFNNPGSSPAPGPSTFGGESAGGIVADFPDRNEVWAYSTGRAFRVKGFQNGKVIGESRQSGTVMLDRVYEIEGGASVERPPLRIAKTNADLMANPAGWEGVPVAKMVVDGKELATAQFAAGPECLFGRIVVRDSSPLENSADQLEQAFKWGDSVSLVIGPAHTSKTPAPGDMRLLVAALDGKARLIAMKAFTSGKKRPFEYFTPASGKVPFEFVGEVPDGKVSLSKTADGYTATFSLPKSELEFPLTSGTALRGDVELRLSGQGQRGLQAISRNYIFTPDTAATGMTDDIPAEAQLYPEYWGVVEVE